MRLGFAKQDVSPDHPVDLAGHAGVRRSTRVLDNLHVRALALQDDAGTTLALVSVDAIWVPQSLVDSVRAWAREALGLPPETILIAATHTHSSPEPREHTFYEARLDREWRLELEQAIKTSIGAAIDDVSVGSLSAGEGWTSVGINRRRAVVDVSQLKRGRLVQRVSNRPNPQGPYDGTLSALWLERHDGLMVVVVNSSCHPVLLSGTDVSADWPGTLPRLLSARMGRPVEVLFLQGFSGNVRPRRLIRLPLRPWPPRRLVEAILDGLRFDKECDPASLDAFATPIVDVLAAMPRSHLAAPEFSATEVEVPLPLETPPPMRSFRDLAATGKTPAERAFARRIVEHYETLGPVPLRVQRLALTPNHRVLALNAEVFAEYGLALRRARHFLMPVGCANGMIGYLPTSRALAEGGYEPDRSLVLFGLASRFTPEVEATTLAACQSVLT